jgi:hypothetical protein
VLRLTDFLDTRAFPHDPSCDWTTGVDFGLYANDTYGNCGPVSMANHRRLVTKWLAGQEVQPTLSDVFDLYRRSGNPTFDPSTGEGDGGVEMRVMLNAAHKGGLAGVKPVAYATIDSHDPDQVRAAVQVFHGILLGVTLDVAQQDQTDRGIWDYVAGSRLWGGHAVLAPAFTLEITDVVTWDLLVACTDSFIRHQDDEAWVVIWPEHLADPRLDVNKLAAAYTALTGKPFPTVPPVPPASPAPSPTPPPGPAPGPGPDPTPADRDAALEAWLTSPHGRAFLATRHYGLTREAALILRRWLTRSSRSTL